LHVLLPNLKANINPVILNIAELFALTAMYMRFTVIDAE